MKALTQVYSQKCLLSVAARVVAKEVHDLVGNKVSARKPTPSVAVAEETTTTVPGQILISNVPENMEETMLKISFETEELTDGGPVEKVTLNREAGVASITFADSTGMYILHCI